MSLAPSVRCLIVALLLPMCLSAQERPRQVILFIGDGVGASAWTAARFAADALAVERFRIMGLVDTRASDSDVTDSGAGATAYSAGVRTFNGAIGVGPDSAPATTVLQVARDRGWATGLVATSSVTHATPASFAAHVPSRASEFDIARQIVENRVDVLLGAGLRYFSRASRPDSVDLIERLRTTHTVVTTPEALVAVDLRATSRLAGFFGASQMPSAPERRPSLPDMTRIAIEVLSRDPDGFFLMVEGSQIDWEAHDNGSLEALTAEMLDFDRAIGVALDYQARNPRTLLLVTADHETGGLAIELARDSVRVEAAIASLRAAFGQVAGTKSLLGEDHQPGLDTLLQGMTTTGRRLALAARNGGTRLVARYTTDDHTAQMVPLFAMGPGAERFGGILDNYRVGQLLLELVRR